jgi:hypothetical protein
MAVLQFLAKRVLSVFGVEVRRPPADPVREFGVFPEDPITHQYLCRLPESAMLRVPLADARAGVVAFPFVGESPHPLIMAAQTARAARDVRLGSEDVLRLLENFYRCVQPGSALEVLDLAPEEAPGLVGVERDFWVFPWTARGIQANAHLRKIALSEEGLQQLTRSGAKDGMTLYGPVGPRKLALETKRIVTLVASLQEHGYREDRRDHPQVVALRSDAGYRWLVVQGQHRFAACAALGMTELKAAVSGIVRREDAPYWPHVVSNCFTEEGALKVFDRLFSGLPPPWARWNPAPVH